MNDINGRHKVARLPFFDLLKMFAMFMVLWGHTIQHLQTGDVWNEPVHKFIYSFHLPLFMTIAGFFSVSSLNLKIGDFLKKKGIQLLLPCLTWGILLYVVIILLNTFVGCSISYSPFFVFFQHFWFLKSLFICYLIAYFYERCLNRNTLIGVIVSLLIAHISTTHQIPIMYICFLSGIFLRKNFGVFCQYYKTITTICLCVYSAIYVTTDGCLTLKGINLIDTIRLQAITPPLCNYLSKIVISVSSSLLLIGVLYGLSQIAMINKKIASSSLTSIGKNTLGIYLLQSIVLETIMSEFIKVDKFGGVFANIHFVILIVFPIVSMAVMMFCDVCIKQIRSNRYLSFLLLGVPLT